MADYAGDGDGRIWEVFVEVETGGRVACLIEIGNEV